MLAHAQHWTFTVDDYERMAQAGILGEDDRVELIEGEIVQMSPVGSTHAAVVNHLNHLLNRQLGGRAIVSIQNPLRLHDLSEPEPDLCLLDPRADFYRAAHPTPRDTRLIIEVSDTSLPFDREVKTPLYARCGIPELWIVDLRANVLLVHREPGKDGYTRVETLGPGASVAPLAFPDLRLDVTQILS